MIIALSGKKQHGKNLVASIIQYLLTNPNTISYTGSYNSYVMDIGMGMDNTSGWEQKMFAGKLKQFVALVLNMNIDDLEKEEVKNQLLPEIWRRYFFRAGKRNDRKVFVHEKDETVEENELITVRKFLQEVGTEALRNHIHPDFWFNSLMSNYVPIASPPYRRHIGNATQGIDGFWYIPADHPVAIKNGYKGHTQINSNTFSWTEEITEPVYPDWIITDTRFPNETDRLLTMGAILIRVNRPTIESTDNHPSETALDKYPFKHIITNDGTLEDLIAKVKALLIELNLIKA